MRRFSLSTLFLLVIIIALSIAVFNVTSQLRQARAELTKLRKEIRVLDPSEPEKMRAIEVPSFAQNQWRWRIDLPDDEKFVLRWAYNNIPAGNSLPAQIDPVFNHPKFYAPTLPSDEFMLLIHAFEENGNWMLGVSTESTSGRREISFSIEMQADDSSWLAKRGGKSIDALAGKKETSVNPVDSPFVLLRYRKAIFPSPGVVSIDPNPTDGILIWIERATNNHK